MILEPGDKAPHPQRGYGSEPRVAGAGRRLPWESDHLYLATPIGVELMPLDRPDSYATPLALEYFLPMDPG